MGKLRNTVLILGEGPTEFYYFNSLSEEYKGLSIQPDFPKHTSIKELEKKIAEGVEKGYDHIFCIIDMDNKDKDPECSQYARLKKKYAQPIDKKNQGLHCEVKFFETHRCTELFFLYYFCYTSREYPDQESLLNDVNRHVEYCKEKKFFDKCKGLHSYFVRNGGSLATAIANAEHSLKEKEKSGREYTYSELGSLMKELDILTGK